MNAALGLAAGGINGPLYGNSGGGGFGVPGGGGGDNSSNYHRLTGKRKVVHHKCCKCEVSQRHFWRTCKNTDCKHKRCRECDKMTKD